MPDAPTARSALAAGVIGNRLYAIGGVSGPALTTLEIFDFRTRRWEQLPDMTKERGGNSAAATADGRVVAFGGEEGAGTIKEVEVYDARRRRWRRLADMRTSRHGLGGVGFGSRIFALQGGPTPGFSYSGVVEALTVR
jgi:hypothetical protein